MSLPQQGCLPLWLRVPALLSFTLLVAVESVAGSALTCDFAVFSLVCIVAIVRSWLPTNKETSLLGTKLSLLRLTSNVESDRLLSQQRDTVEHVYVYSFHLQTVAHDVFRTRCHAHFCDATFGGNRHNSSCKASKSQGSLQSLSAQDARMRAVLKLSTSFDRADAPCILSEDAGSKVGSWLGACVLSQPSRRASEPVSCRIGR
jgi:hypothetical protein